MTTGAAPANYSNAAAGWAMFAGIMLIIYGVLDAIQGIVGLANNEFFVLSGDYIFKFDVTTWGWIHLIGGIVLIAAGAGIFSGNVFARTIGVIAAGLSIIWNFAWLPYYPIWSIISIAIGIAVIWALAAHGRDLAYARG